jgi:beta-lactamase regulating signal transducer with metallopeptidase domain/Leucine-rich repeat (LRR) protein
MIRELLLRDLSLWGCVWQSVAFLGLGIVAGRLLRRRPSRAYQVLLFVMVAAVCVPFLSAVVRHYHLGLLTARLPELQRGPLGELRTATFDTMDASPAQDSRSAFLQEHVSSGPAVVSAARDGMTWGAFVLYAWITATVALMARLVVTFLYGMHLVCRARRQACEPMQQAADAAASKVGILKGLQVRASARIRSPVVWCWSRPPILLVPSDYQDGRTDWAGVVAHELAHCTRWDHLTGLLAELAVSLLPWNPLMWLSKRQLIRLGEEACDDWVVATGHPSEDYAESLLCFRPQRQMAFVPAVVHSRTGVAARVRRILNDACGNPRAGVKWALGVTIMVACIAAGLAFAQTRPAEPSATTAGQADPTSQNADKPAANPEKPEQPRYAARTFNSKTAFAVYVQETSESQPGYLGRYIGQTPSAAPLEIPPCWLWSVCTPGPVKDRDLLIREIRESGVPGLEWYVVTTDSDVSRLADLTELRHLGLGGNPITDAGLMPLKGMTRLESLRLFWSPQVTDAGLVHLRSLSGLRSLDLRSPKLTDAGLVQLLDALPGLQELALWEPLITEKGLQHLQSLPGLRTLALSNIPITNAGLQHLTSLRKLDLSFGRSFGQITDTALAPLKDLTTLRELTLNLEFSNVTDAGLAPLKDVSALRKLDLWGTKITDAGLAHLKGLSELRELWLNGCTSITDAGLAHLKGLTKLQSLRLNGCEQVTGACLQYLSNMAELRQLDIPYGPVADADLQHLKGLRGLVRFHAKGPGITDAGLANFKALPRLRSLELVETEITDVGLEHLSSLTALDDLELQSDQITDAGLAHLKDLTKLTGLGLGGARITDAGLAHLKGLTELRFLGLRHARITDAALEHLKGLPALHSLDFRDTPISGTGFAHLKNLTQLQVLELDGCPITDAGLEHIGGLTRLTILRLQHIPITDTGLEHLRALTELTDLVLQDTRITGAGLRHLKGLTQLRSLSLWGSPITDAGLEGIKGLTGLQVLDLSLSGTRVTDAGIQQLKQSLPNLHIAR